jgi:peroxiredoxin
MRDRARSGCTAGLVQESLIPQERWVTLAVVLVWYNGDMNATRRRGAALVAASLLVVAALAISPAGRPLVRRLAYDLGLRVPPHAVREGERLPPLALTTLDGTTAQLNARPGRRLLINVFATWCTPCQEETPALSSAAPVIEKSGTEIVGIDQAESGASVKRFADAYALHYPLYIDPAGAAQVRLGARVIPTTLLVDPQGVVRFIHVGPLSTSDFEALAKGPLADR